MAKARSPRYPSIGLKEAIDKARLIYENDYQNKVPKKIIAEHMGYNSLNGKSLGVIAALTRYGLIEGRGEETGVSDLALAIIAHEPGAPKRVAAIQEAAAKPELFKELDTKFRGGQASDSAIRSYLLTQKFIPEAADNVVRSYRETKDLVAEETTGYDAVDSEAEEDVPMQRSQNPLTSVPQPPPPSVPFKVELAGDRLRVSADVDLKGLKKLMKVLEAQKPFLEPDEDEDALTEIEN